MNARPNLLLVNTNTQQLRSYATFLSKQGISVLVASQFIQGKDIANKKLPKLIVFFIHNNEFSEAKNILHELNLLDCKIITIHQSTEEKDQLRHLSNVSSHLQSEITAEKKLLELCLHINPALQTTQSKPTAENSALPKILLIEDNSLNQIYYGEILNKLPINYILSEGIEKANQELSQHTFDLVISDVRLNDGNGIHFMNQLMEQSKCPSPFIFISGYTKTELEQMYGKFNAFAVLTKPIDEATLVKNIENCMKINFTKSTNTTDQKKYNYQKIYQILKNDPTKIEASIQEFQALMDRSIQVTAIVMENQQFEDLRITFHDLLNLCTYFGADALFEMVMSFRRESNMSVRIKLLEQIHHELKCVADYYKQPEKSGNTTN